MSMFTTTARFKEAVALINRTNQKKLPLLLNRILGKLTQGTGWGGVSLCRRAWLRAHVQAPRNAGAVASLPPRSAPHPPARESAHTCRVVCQGQPYLLRRGGKAALQAVGA